jgi:hypothetical protein
MLKFGIHSAEQLSRAHPRTWLGGRRAVAADLYPAARLVDERIADSLLGLLALANGTFKRTRTARFPEFDQRVAEHLASVAHGRVLLIHDVAVSDGRTAVEFFRHLDAMGVTADYLASDLVPFIYVYPAKSKGMRIVVDPEAQLLQVVAPPFVFNVNKLESARWYPLNHLIRIGLQAIVVPRLQRELAREGLEAAERVDLVCPECRELTRATPRFRLDRHDLFHPAGDDLDVVRAMNILNPSYFSEAETGRILDAFRASLAPGGLLVTGSNQDAGSLVEGGVYRSTPAGFEAVFELGGGSRVRSLILGLEPTGPAAAGSSRTDGELDQRAR